MDRSAMQPAVSASVSHPRISQKSLAINAAFLKDIKDDNRELKRVLDRLSPLVQHWQVAVNHWPEMVELLGELRDQLAFHFSLEEAYGYFEEAIETAPELSLVAECLRDQHATLFGEVRDLADRILEVAPENGEGVSDFLRTLDGFRRRFERHEEDELALILDSMDDDLGISD